MSRQCVDISYRIQQVLIGASRVDNRAGGSTNIGAEFVARAAPDGYTLFMASSTQVINATLYPK
ncbi:MAG: tripartite tricarboxylate transporter substrate-binding protein, partial [Burkholderiaceae bacterium]